MNKILVVDDEKEIADLVELYLKNENYTVYKYYSAKEVLDNIDNLDVDLAILDVMMPEIDGFMLCNKIREKYTFPIIFATAKVEEIDKINGLMIGADDYVTKPFQPLELIARVKAQLRRSQKYNNSNQKENVIDFRGILINKDTHEFYFNEKKVELTKIEFEIFCNTDYRYVLSKIPVLNNYSRFKIEENVNFRYITLGDNIENIRKTLKILKEINFYEKLKANDYWKVSYECNIIESKS